MAQDLSFAVYDQQEVKPRFTHLHLHTPWSLLDGFCRIDDLIELAKEYGMDSIGVSEHGNCHSHIEFYTKCKEAGIKPILGCEAYITPHRTWKKAEFSKVTYKLDTVRYRTKQEMEDEGAVEFTEELIKEYGFDISTLSIVDAVVEQTKGKKKKEKLIISAIPRSGIANLFSWRPKVAHLLLIAKDNEGYKNLLKISTTAHLEGMYYKPRADYKLIKEYGKGIIATSACIGGEIPQCILKGKHKLGKNIARFYQKCFEEFYFEVQPSDMPEQIIVNETLKEWSKEMGIPLVATSDAHMLKKEELAVHKALTLIGKSEDDSDISVYQHCYFKNVDEMLAGGVPPEALENAYDIAQRCNVEIEIGHIHLPNFPVPEGYDLNTYLARLVNEGLFDLALREDFNWTEYQDRVDYELEVISKKGFAGYFLIVWDFIKFAKDNGILVGPGRGSGAGSLVAYLLKIVNINPMKYGLLFERFLNPERKALPDFDTDFDYERRHEVVDYVTEKYGTAMVAQIGTFSTLSTKAAFKDIARGLGIDHTLINEMNKLIPSLFGKVYTIEEALDEVAELREWQEKFPQLFELALQVEKLPRSQSIHACGVVITPDPIVTAIPLMKGKNGEIVTQFDSPTLELLGRLKFDFLGLKNLSVINIAKQLVMERHSVDIHPDDLEPNDPFVFRLIKEGNTDGIFQIESPGMKKMFRGMNKVDMEDLIAGISLYRPGPMAWIPNYVDRANGLRVAEYLTPEIEEITRGTHGILVYQEQVMQISRKMAKYTAGEADVLRKAIGKKKESVMRPALIELERRIQECGHSEEIAKKIIGMIEPFVGYGFNKSHAAAYALIAYQTAYFKAYYPAEFMAALLTVFGDNDDKVKNYIVESKRMGIKILPPDVNFSGTGFTIEDDNLRFGLMSIKGLGEGVLPNIMEKKPFSSLEHLIESIPKKSLNKKVVTVLAQSGALDLLGKQFNNRMEILAHLFKLRGDKDDLTDLIQGFTNHKKLQLEEELLGIFVSGHLLDDHAKPLNWDYIPDGVPFETAGIVTSFKETYTKGGTGPAMAFVNIETLEGQRRIVVFPNEYEAIQGQLDKDLIIKITLYKKYDPRYDERSYIVKKITIPKRINKSILESKESIA